MDTTSNFTPNLGTVPQKNNEPFIICKNVWTYESTGIE